MILSPLTELPIRIANPSLRSDAWVAIITGAGRGIGRTHAHLLIRRGAAVVVNDLGGHTFAGHHHHRPMRSSRRSTSREGGGSRLRRCVRTGDATALVQRALDELCRLDIVINNAGIARFRTARSSANSPTNRE